MVQKKGLHMDAESGVTPRQELEYWCICDVAQVMEEHQSTAALDYAQVCRAESMGRHTLHHRDLCW